MAAAAPSYENLVECPVCFEIYIRPQILPCLHVICEDCCHGIAVNNEVECPICRQITKVDSIKFDFNKQSLVDTFTEAEAVNKPDVTVEDAGTHPTSLSSFVDAREN